MRIVPTFAAFITALALVAMSGPATAQSDTAKRGDGTVRLQLNKLEPSAQSCRAYFVVENRMGADVDNINLDVFLFDATGEIRKRVALNTRALRDGKTYVRIFELADLACADIDRILLNEVLECTLAHAPSDPACADGVEVSSRTETSFID